ncbi:hypothetical protein PENTCL1PPCAC_18608, partial [Pristionchus entomophagus]
NMWSLTLLLVISLGIFQSTISEPTTYDDTKSAVNNAADSASEAAQNARETVSEAARGVADSKPVQGVRDAVSSAGETVAEGARGVGDSKPAQGIKDVVHKAGEKPIITGFVLLLPMTAYYLCNY